MRVVFIPIIYLSVVLACHGIPPNVDRKRETPSSSARYSHDVYGMSVLAKDKDVVVSKEVPVKTPERFSNFDKEHNLDELLKVISSMNNPEKLEQIKKAVTGRIKHLGEHLTKISSND